MARHIVGRVSEIPPGDRKIVEVQGRSIGVFNVQGTFYALRSSCPHQAAPLCRGTVTGTNLPSAPGEYKWARDGEIIRCPWHGWEFDITNGRSIFNPHRLRVKAYAVTVEHGTVEHPTVDGDSVHSKTVEDIEEEDESVETYPVTVEEELVILYT